jgi:hypothetical protein
MLEQEGLRSGPNSILIVDVAVITFTLSGGRRPETEPEPAPPPCSFHVHRALTASAFVLYAARVLLDVPLLNSPEPESVCTCRACSDPVCNPPAALRCASTSR